jgi:hypothetical protein
MAKRREERYASAEELRQALEHAASSISQPIDLQRQWPADTNERRALGGREASGATPLGAPERMRREDFDAYERSLRLRRWLGVLVVPLVLGCAGLAVFLATRREAAVSVTEVEPNASAAQANPLALGRPIRGQIGKRLSLYESDRDFFRFTLGPGEHVVRAEVTGIGDLDLKLEIYDGAGGRRADYDTGGKGDGEIIPNLRLTGGGYYAEVRAVWVQGQQATENVSDWYTLTISARPPAADEESEPDDDPASARAIELDRPMRGWLSHPLDVDCFVPHGSGGGMLYGSIEDLAPHEARLLALPALRAPGSASPGESQPLAGPLPPGAKAFDQPVGASTLRFDGIPWTEGAPPPVLCLGLRPDKRHAQAEPHPTMAGRDQPYRMIVRVKR